MRLVGNRLKVQPMLLHLSHAPIVADRKLVEGGINQLSSFPLQYVGHFLRAPRSLSRP